MTYTIEPDGSLVTYQRIKADKTLTILRPRTTEALGAGRNDLIEIKLKIIERYKEANTNEQH